MATDTKQRQRTGVLKHVSLLVALTRFARLIAPALVGGGLFVWLAMNDRLDIHDMPTRFGMLLFPVVLAFVWRAFVVVLENPDGTLLPVGLVRVMDGDTVVVNHAGASTKIRIYACDAPEKDQPGGEEAMNRLYELCTSGQLSFKPTGEGSFDRTVASLYVDGRDVALLMIEEGMAWSSELKYKPPAHYINACANAMQQRLGLFAQRNAIHPSDWRKQKGQKEDVGINVEMLQKMLRGEGV